MKFKGLDYKNVDQLINPASIKAIKAAWNSSLKHQISEEKLQSVDIVISELKEIFNKVLKV